MTPYIPAYSIRSVLTFARECAINCGKDYITTYLPCFWYSFSLNALAEAQYTQSHFSLAAFKDGTRCHLASILSHISYATNDV